MATKKKAAKKAAPVTKKPAVKFAKKSKNGKGRTGPKIKAIWLDAATIINLITKGPAPRNVPKLLASIMEKLDQNGIKKLLRIALEKMDEKTRKGMLKKYWHETRVTMSEQDRKDMLAGRRVRKMMDRK